MFPLSQEILLFAKFFVFFTCVFFWVKLAYDGLKRSARIRLGYHRHDRDQDR